MRLALHVDDGAATDLAAHDSLGDRDGIREGHRAGEGVEQVEVEARRRGVSEAEVVRDALRSTLVKTRIEPRGALFHGREPIADRVDELLAEGFGQ